MYSVHGVDSSTDNLAQSCPTLFGQHPLQWMILQNHSYYLEVAQSVSVLQKVHVTDTATLY